MSVLNKKEDVIDDNYVEKNIETEKINVFSSFRFIAFLIIFLWHTNGWTRLNFNGATFAVSFFIIISGFLNGVKYCNRYNKVKIKGIKDLILRRNQRTYKLHIVMLLICIPLTGVFVINSIENIIKWGAKFVLNAFLLQGYVNKSSIYFSFNGVSWFLCF